MLRFLTGRVFNRFDAVWLMFFALAWRDGRYFAAAVACIAGAMVSGFLEGKAKQPTPTTRGREP